VLLERHHGYIQWLFPIREHGMNADSQPLTIYEAEAIRANPEAKRRLLDSFHLMLDFYGMTLTDPVAGTFERSAHCLERFAGLNRYGHNYLRITRIIKCLQELGFPHLVAPWVSFMLKEIYETGELCNAGDSCANYWIPVIREEAARAQLEAQVQGYRQQQQHYQQQHYQQQQQQHYQQQQQQPPPPPQQQQQQQQDLQQDLQQDMQQDVQQEQQQDQQQDQQQQQQQQQPPPQQQPQPRQPRQKAMGGGGELSSSEED
jgi:hypothetical protein